MIETNKIHLGDCRDILADFPENSVDAVVTDPPYELGFMGKKWDSSGVSYDVKTWAAALRVLKPGGHLLAFGGTRTYHRIACAIEDAGFEIRDQLQWIYASGFPKSLNINKVAKEKICGCQAIPKHGLRQVPETNLSETIQSSTTENETMLPVVQEQSLPEHGSEGAKSKTTRKKQSGMERRSDSQAPEGELPGSPLHKGSGMGETDGAEGRLHYGTSLSGGRVGREDAQKKRGSEPQGPSPIEQQENKSGTLAVKRIAQDGRGWEICPRCSKPMVADGLGTALKPANEPICLARKPLSEKTVAANVLKWGVGALNIDASRIGKGLGGSREGEASKDRDYTNRGVTRFQGKPGPRGGNAKGRFPANVILDEEAGKILDGQSGNRKAGGNLTGNEPSRPAKNTYGHMPDRREWESYGDSGGASRFFYCTKASKAERGIENNHPTVKPIALMQYLIGLVLPPGGVVLDPFLGSGTLIKAARGLGVDWIGVELDPEYIKIAEGRISGELF